ncbi:GNAT family N-acetyltransferase [Halothermothrix orenii]|uniref:Acetyltransferase n=1 Tax=Halothermothrix orenii (strain H 168 / OCM 544 / DSM 9562) TaxID=373903 RepID=B8CZU9_HALOH|nr:GNAT family N-acetyltransferase [Halothermothrix orenii]ACL70801.1 Acetyltransferase [Halothermothrix orenii H 168]
MNLKDLKLISDYKNNDILRKSFNDLAKRVFGISFENWYQQGLWGDNYICYSFLNEDKIVSNVSITKMRLLMGETERRLIQLGTVMTDSTYRGKGLAKDLMKHVLKEYEKDYDAIFLFANKNVLDFYPSFGFERREQVQFFTRDVYPGEAGYNFRRLDMGNLEDIKILKEITKSRVPTANDFFIANNEDILYWYCLEIFNNNIYYCEDEGLIVIASVKGGMLHIYDVISRLKIDYKRILASFQNSKTIETIFHFTPDSNGLELESRTYDQVEEDDYLFVKGNFSLDNYAFPITAHA